MDPALQHRIQSFLKDLAHVCHKHSAAINGGGIEFWPEGRAEPIVFSDWEYYLQAYPAGARLRPLPQGPPLCEYKET